VVCVVELVVDVVNVLEVDVIVELMVVVPVAVCAGYASGVGLAEEGEVATRRIRKNSNIPSVTAWACERVGDRLNPFSYVHFLALLIIPKAIRPRPIPTTIDPNGNPGIAGISVVLLLI